MAFSLDILAPGSQVQGGAVLLGQGDQMILQAVFISAQLDPIHGLGQRANPALAVMLLDYVREKEAAGRRLPVELWRCVTPFDGHKK